MTFDVNLFKKAVIEAARIREDSYDHHAANQAETGFETFYSKSYFESCQEACELVKLPPEMAYPLYLLISQAWNDILDWSNDES